MGLLDRFLSIVGPNDAGRALDPKGPLGLVPGDVVTYYQERFVVSGVRYLQGDGSAVFHYCMRDAQGVWVVLAADDCPDPVFSLQRRVEATVDWDADVLEDVADEPFRIVQRGKSKVRLFGDTGLPPTRSVKYREYEDSEGERMLVLEDYGSAREIRVGEPVYDGELGFAEGGDRTGNRPWATVAAGLDESPTTDGSDFDKGSPAAAAAALDSRVSLLDQDAPPLEVEADREPSAFADAEWADSYDDELPAEPLPGAGRGVEVDDSKDGWLSATRFVSGAGEAHVEEDDEWLSS